MSFAHIRKAKLCDGAYTTQHHTLNDWMIWHTHSHRHRHKRKRRLIVFLCVKKITIFTRKQAHLCHISSDNFAFFVGVVYGAANHSSHTRLRTYVNIRQIHAHAYAWHIVYMYTKIYIYQCNKNPKISTPFHIVWLIERLAFVYEQTKKYGFACTE